MRIRQLNFNKARIFVNPENDTGVLTFIKPLGSKLDRVFFVPSLENKEEIMQVLNTICTRFHNNIWYFHMDTAQTEDEIHQTFHYMNVPTVTIGLDASPELSN